MRITATFALCLSLASCGLSPSEPEPVEEKKPTSRHIGQIASIHAAQNFVLIRRAPGITVPPGTILISEGVDGTAANLRASGESLGQMIAADIQSGIPQVGDPVREPLIEEGELEAEIPEEES